MSENENPLSAGNVEVEELEAPRTVTVTALEALERAEVDIAIATAKRYPRDLAAVKTEMRQMACKDPEIAASCTYAMPRAGRTITGPSVRLAEIASSCFGNLSVVVRVVQMGDETVTSQAVSHDLQKNVRIGLEIPRPVQPRKLAPDATQERKDAALRDAKHLAALACNSIAFRESVFKVIPRSLIKPIWEEAQAVATGKGRSFDEARENCLAKFGEIGVSRKKVYDYLEIGGIEALTTGHLNLLFGVLTAIAEGETTVEAEFGPKEKMPKDTVKAEVPKPKVVLTEGLTPGGRVGSETKTTVATVEPEPELPTPPKDMFDDDIPDLPKKQAPKPKAEPKPESKPLPAKPIELDPVYARVQKKMEQSDVTLSQFLRVLSYWGIPVSNAKVLTDVRVGAIKTADNDWQSVLDELAMSPDEAA